MVAYTHLFYHQGVEVCVVKERETLFKPGALSRVGTVPTAAKSDIFWLARVL